ncbi:hypothetical protein ACA910_014499 [Epithemia clementina (nom. ined.)]
MKSLHDLLRRFEVEQQRRQEQQHEPEQYQVREQPFFEDGNDTIFGPYSTFEMRYFPQQEICKEYFEAKAKLEQRIQKKAAKAQQQRQEEQQHQSSSPFQREAAKTPGTKGDVTKEEKESDSLPCCSSPSSPLQNTHAHKLRPKTGLDNNDKNTS